MIQGPRELPYGGPARGASARTSGFTLVELTVVLVLITLFSALVVPSVVSATRQRTVGTQGENLTELLRFAYLSAITRHSPVQVRVDENRGLCLVTASHTALPWLDEQQRASTELLATLKMPDNIRLEMAQTEEDRQTATGSREGQTVTFTSDGRADSVVMTLTSTEGDRCAVEVVGVTGEVLVRKNEP